MDFRQLMRDERARRQREQQTAASAGAKRSNSSSSSESATGSNSDVDPALLQAPLRMWRERSKLEIERYATTAISGVYYVPNWIAQDEEDAILERVYGVPDTSRAWVALKRRRLQMWGGEVKSPFCAQPLPAWLLEIVQSLVDAQVFSEEHRPNHALINEYGVGDGILPHEDGPSYFPFVAIISTGAAATVTFTPHRAWRENALAAGPAAAAAAPDGSHSFELARCSLLLFTGDAYTKYLHSIDAVEHGKRVSLTIRHVRA